ncbi:MAG: FtsX-like permease family protein, partial [Muribaculaceae bacterium]|nr:FtsX-like permease family protein [Muribaculaceae bacterium]
YKVVGVAGDRSENINLNGRTDECISIPLTVFMQVYNCGEKIGGCLLILCDDQVKVSDLRPYIERILRRNHNLHPDDRKAIGMQDVSEVIEMIGTLFTGIDFLALFIGVSTLISGIIGIGNIMWVIVKERTQEIGIRRAIGAKPSDITMQILSEGCVLTFFAGSLGVCFAVLILYVVDMGLADGQSLFQLTFSHSVAIMFAFCVLGTIAGIIPALKAMHIKPIEAINDK